MERIRNLFAGSLSFALFFLLASTTWAQIDVGNFTISGAGEVGGLPMSRSGKDSKFEEYRDLPETVIVPELQLMIGGKKEDFYLNFDAGKVGREDQNFSLRAGRYGLLDIQFEWDQIPHLFDTARTPFSTNGGNFTLSSRPTLPVSGANTCGANSVCQWLNQQGVDHPVDLSILDKIARLKVRYTPNPGWTFTGTYWSNRDTGNRAFGILNGASSSTMNISELAEPIDYQTHNVELGGEYAGKGWSVALKYNGSFFHNNVSTLDWDNPIHAIVGGTTIGNAIFGGSCVDSIAFTPASGIGPCQGRLDLYPSNQAHTISLTGTATLPLNTRFLATASYGWRLQDDRFLPFTNNRCYTTNPLLVGSASPDCTVALVAMPTISRNNFGGDVRPLMVNTTLVNNSLVSGLNLKAFYRLYDLSNHSASVKFPQGFVINDTTINVDETENELNSYSKNTAGLEAGYNFTSWLNGKFSYTWDKMHRTTFETVNSNEHTLGPTLDIKALSWLSFRAKYSHSWRDSDASGTTLEMVYLGKRNRDKASLYTDITPLDNLTFYAGFEATADTYPNGSASTILSNAGLQNNHNYSPSVGFLYSPLDWLRLFGDYNWDLNKWKLNMNNSTGVISNGRDRVNTFSLGSDMEIIKNLLGFRLQYTFSQGLSEISNRGGAGPAATDYPNSISTWHELLARFEYQIHKNVALKVGYYFNALREKDPGVDLMKQWMGDVIDPGENANQLGSQQRSIFLGDQFKGPFTAHVGFVALRLKF